MVKLRKATTHYSITTYRAPGRLRRARKKTETDESLEEELEDVKAKVREIYCGMKQEEPKGEEGKKDGKEGQLKGEVKKEEPNNGKQEIRVEDTDSDEEDEDEEYDDEDGYSNESVWTSDEDSHCSEKSMQNCPGCCKRNFCQNTIEMSIKAVEQEIHAKLVAGAYPPPIPLKDFLCHMEREEKECKKTVELKVEPVVESKKLPALKRGFFLNSPAKEVVVKKEEEEEKEVESAKVESKKSTSSKKSNKKTKKVIREASPEVIEVPIVKPRPVKCSLCSKDIFPMDEVYFKMTCQDECNLTLHKTCFQNSMSEQGFKKKRDYKDAICVTEGCNAHVVSVYQRDIHDVENLYIKCTEAKPINKIHMASLKKEKAKSNKKENKKPTKVKPTPAGRLPSTPSKEEEKATVTSELSEIGNNISNNVIHQQPLSDQTNHQQQTTMVESTPGIRQPQLSRPIHCDVDERSDVNVVPLVKKPDTQIVCKYAVSDSPTRVMPKTKTQKKKKIIPIDTPSRVNRSNQVNEYGADFHDYDPSVACFGYPSSSSEQTAVPNNWEEAMEIVHPIGESILAILKPNLLDLLCNTPPPELGDLPVDGLLDTIRLVFGENLTNEQFLWLEKIFKYPSNILFSFINNLEHFSISESNGQMFYRKLSHGPSSFIKHNNGHQERDPFISEASPKDITFPRFDANPVMPNQFSNSPSNSPPSASFGGSSFNNMDSVNSSLQQDHNSFLSNNRSDPPHRNSVFDFIHDTSSSRFSRNHAMQDQRRVDKWFSSSSSNSPLPKDQSNTNNSNGLFYERHTSVGSNEGYQSCEHTPPIEESFGNMRMKDQQQRVNSTNNDEQYRRHLESAQNRVMDTLAKESADFKAQRDELQTKMNSLSRKLRQLEFSNNSLEQANNSYKFANIEAECERKITTAASTIEHVSIIINKLETIDDSSCSEVVRILNSYQRKMNVYMRSLQKMSEDAHEKSDAALIDYPRTPQFPVEVEQFFQIFPSKEDVMKELPRMMSHIETLSKRRTLHVPDRVELGMMIKAVLGILGPNYTFEAMRSAVVQGLCMRPVNPRLTFTGQSNGEVQQNGHNNYSNDSKPSWKKPCGPTQSREINITNHECVICMESISRGKPMSCTFCEEPYHTQCIRTWLVEHPSCPRCKTNWPDPEYFPSLQ